MAVHVTYFTAAVAGQPAAARVIERVHRTQALADARAAADGVAAYAGAVDDNADVGGLIDTGTGAVLAWARASAAAARTAAWRQRLHAAWRQYNDSSGLPATARQEWWPRIDGSGEALTATDRWCYIQVALGDLLAVGNLGGLNTVAKREAALAHIEAAVGGLGKTWYGVMSGNDARRGDWRQTSTAAGARIYTDLLTAAWAVRPADGSYILLPAGLIPAGLDPDSPTLR